MVRVGGPIRWRLHLPVPRERVYEALADPARTWDAGYIDG